MKLIIIEGARGTGKSTIGFKLRQKLNDVTLINFTGFPLDGIDGREKVCTYYRNWIKFFESIKSQGHNSIFVCDRFFFSEAVFSKLYKSYDFKYDYLAMLHHLTDLADEVEIIFFTIDNEEELKKRLIRDKIPFGNAEESVSQTMRQQEEYKKLFEHLSVFAKDKENITLTTIDTSSKTLYEVEKEVLSIVQQ